MSSYEYQMVQGNMVGKEIVPTHDSWQKEQSERGRRFFESPQFPPRVQRDEQGNIVAEYEGMPVAAGHLALVHCVEEIAEPKYVPEEIPVAIPAEAAVQ